MSNSQYMGPPAPLSGPPNYGAPAARPASGLSIASLIIGVVAVILAIFPFVDYLGWLLAVIGLVLGIVGLLQADRTRGVALAGTIVSAVAFVLATLFAIVYTIGLVAASTTTTTAAHSVSRASPSDEASASPSPAPELPAVGSLSNPYPVGTTLDVSGDITAQLAFPRIAVNANDFVAAANQFNDAPSSGMQWAVLDVTVTNSGTSPVHPGDLTYSINLATPDGQTFGHKFASLDNLLTGSPDLAPGASTTGQIPYQVPAGTASILINAGQSFVVGQ